MIGTDGTKSLRADHRSGRFRYVTYQGKTYSVRVWAYLLKVNYSTLCGRLRALPIEQAFDVELIEQGIQAPGVSAELWPGANKTPFDEDEIMQEIVAEFAPLTLHECGFILGLTRERVRQIERQALEKLRKRVAALEAAHV